MYTCCWVIVKSVSKTLSNNFKTSTSVMISSWHRYQSDDDALKHHYIFGDINQRFIIIGHVTLMVYPSLMMIYLSSMMIAGNLMFMTGPLKKICRMVHRDGARSGHIYDPNEDLRRFSKSKRCQRHPKF